MTYLVLLAFAIILGSLAAALYYMLRGGATQTQKSRNMARALGMRVGISVLLFACLMLAWKLGYIHPTGIAAGR